MTDTTLISKGKSTRVISTGSIGPPGPKGATGSQGPEGPIGHTGPIGPGSSGESLFLPPTSNTSGLVAAAQAADAAGGGIVILPSRITLDTNPDFGPLSNVHIRGSGIGATLVTLNGYGVSLSLGGTNITMADFSVTNIDMTWHSSPWPAVQLWGVVGFEIFRVEVYNHPGPCIWLRGASHGSVHHCMSHDCYLDGVHVAGSVVVSGVTYVSTHVRVHDNDIWNLGDDGVGISGELIPPSIITVHDNNIENTGNGVGIYGGERLNIHDNQINNTGGCGILMQTGNTGYHNYFYIVDVHHNQIQNAGQYITNPNVWGVGTQVITGGIVVYPTDIYAYPSIHYMDEIWIRDNVIDVANWNYISVGASAGVDSTHGVDLRKLIIERNRCYGTLTATLSSGPTVSGSTWTHIASPWTKGGVGINVLKAENLYINDNLLEGTLKEGILIGGGADGLGVDSGGTAWSVQNNYGIRYYYEVNHNTIRDPWKTYASGEQIVAIRLRSGPLLRCCRNNFFDPNNNGASQPSGVGVTGGLPLTVYLSDLAITSEAYISGNLRAKTTGAETWIAYETRSIGAGGQPAFGTGWVNYSGYPEQVATFIKDEHGRVKLRGRIKNGLISDVPGPQIFVLPVGYRPIAYTRSFVVVSNGSPGIVRIDQDGQVWAVSGSKTSLHLDGIEFDAEV